MAIIRTLKISNRCTIDMKNAPRKLKEIKHMLRSHYHIKRTGIFGSYVRSEENEKSDPDISVAFDRPTDIFNFMKLEEILSEKSDVKTGLVSKPALKPFTGERLLREATYV